MRSEGNEICFLAQLCALSLNLLLSTFSIKHPLGKAEVAHVLISQYRMNKKFAWLLVKQCDVPFISLPLP